jgi:hypothetical protein
MHSACKTPCLGERIYANILDDVSLGIIGLDIAMKRRLKKYSIE